MHKIDQGFPGILMSPDLLSDDADHHREGLWGLVLVELFFRLLHDKPATMTANLTEWRVNLPWLNSDPGLTEHVVPALAFLVKSRLTFLLLRFFEIFSEDTQDKNSVVDKVEGLCGEIQDVFEEWSLIWNTLHSGRRTCLPVIGQYRPPHIGSRAIESGEVSEPSNRIL
ncbi:hypothetical protein N0V84_011985 [Fusarium piperis]|uniref:Uncharacterized protein n=1 Tax=Fusarium piperis TaxID=1435070 RepID=A0A9W8TCB7_9HYPO|nr:hypothetical protein N0V84_011985 [Fusarium piperis]